LMFFPQFSEGSSRPEHSMLDEPLIFFGATRGQGAPAGRKW